MSQDTCSDPCAEKSIQGYEAPFTAHTVTTRVRPLSPPPTCKASPVRAIVDPVRSRTTPPPTPFVADCDGPSSRRLTGSLPRSHRVSMSPPPASLTPRRQLSLHFATTRILAPADTLEGIATPLLELVGTALGLDVGGLWTADRESGSLGFVAQWHRRSLRPPRAFRAASESTTFPPGTGLPGRVVAGRQPLWVDDVTTDPSFPRRAAAKRSGLRTGFAVPIALHGDVVGVVEFFSTAVLPSDPAILATVSAVAEQLASFIDRIESQAAIAQLEAHRGGILAAALDAVVSIDDRGRVLDFNPAAERLFGLSRDAVMGQLMVDWIVPPHLREAHRRGFKRYLETGEAVLIGKRIEITALRADGHEFPVELALSRVDLPGRPIFTGQLRDITDRREAETARERFIDIVSHELRTPITAIYGGTRLLARPGLDDESRATLLSDVAAEADRLQHLVEDLLVVIRSERGRAQLRTEPVLLHRLAQRVVEGERDRWPAAQIEITVVGAATPVLADDIAVGQTLRNLLSNAVKYGPPDGDIQIVIENGVDETRVRIFDNGPGVRADEAEKLFEIDYRSPLTASKVEGSGIGLFVCRWLIASMGGRIWAAPRPAGGAEFGFALHAIRDEPIDMA